MELKVRQVWIGFDGIPAAQRIVRVAEDAVSTIMKVLTTRKSASH